MGTLCGFLSLQSAYFSSHNWRIWGKVIEQRICAFGQCTQANPHLNDPCKFVQVQFVFSHLEGYLLAPRKWGTAIRNFLIVTLAPHFPETSTSHFVFCPLSWKRQLCFERWGLRVTALVRCSHLPFISESSNSKRQQDNMTKCFLNTWAGSKYKGWSPTSATKLKMVQTRSWFLELC